MAIRNTPASLTLPVTLSPPSTQFATCIICHERVRFAILTAGSLHADGTQAFACGIHSRDRRHWIIAWSTFETIQRNQQKQKAEVRS
jgi:hypothetical protein